ncbi:MAG: hypothetical protein QNJ05_11980 [Woeseiaceae bacterium]|nr:hypothetical protein [Woeseiaceae bacterium]
MMQETKFFSLRPTAAYRPYIFVIVSLVLLLASCEAAHEDANYVLVVPARYQPDAGERFSGGYRIVDSGFSVIIPAAELEKSINGFVPSSQGVDQKTFVIVEIGKAGTEPQGPPEEVLSVRQELWTLTGYYEDACVRQADEPFENYFRYQHPCDQSRRLLTNYMLLEEDPTAGGKVPEDWANFPFAVCGENQKPGFSSLYVNCLFQESLPSGIRYSFRVRGDNLHLHEEVGEYIGDKLNEWHRSAKE